LLKFNTRTRVIVVISFFTALTAISAFIEIPIPLVPLTLQTLFVLLSGALLGARYGCYSQVVYLCLGLLGLPIFSKGGGIGYIFQPSFGYLFAFPISAYFAGKLIKLLESRGHSFTFYNILLFNFLALLPIFIIGVLYLYINLNYIIGKHIDFYKACWTGFIVFIPGDIIKIILATMITIKMKKYFI
jgi:biotin transport system substrate-specific component